MANELQTPSTGDREKAEPPEVVSREEIRAVRAELHQAQAMACQLRNELDELHRQTRDGGQVKGAVTRLNLELDRHLAKMEHQRAVARKLQDMFLPPALPKCKGVRLAVKYLPCERVGGGLYDVFDMGNSCIGVFVADISGHGLAATMVSGVTKTAVDTFRQNEYSPRVIMEKVNKQLVKNTLETQFVAAFLGVLDLDTFRITFVNASHPCPIVCNGKQLRLLESDGFCCGMFDNPHCEEKEVQLHPGDRVICYNRGLTRSGKSVDTSFDGSTLYDLVRTCGDEPIERVVERLAGEFLHRLGDTEQLDDAIIVGLELLPRETGEERIVVPSEPRQLGRIERGIVSRLKAENYGERFSFAIRLAVEEAVINAMKHGNHMHEARKVTVTYSVDSEQVRISVEDEGEGFDPNSVPDPTTDENLLKPSGRGLMLIRAYMDEVQFNEKCNRITMIKKAPWAD